MVDFLARQTLSHLICLVFGILSLFVTCVTSGRDVCDVYGHAYTYCDDGYYCCDNDTRCCSNTLSVGAIIGIVFGIIFLITVCVLCAFMVLKKKKLRPRQLIHTQNTTSVSTVQHQQNRQTMPMYTIPQNQGHPNHALYPPPYAQPTGTWQQPPQYSEINTSAYPPPEYKQ